MALSRGGADGITAHLREDRRHIGCDIDRLMATLRLPLNSEMGATAEMQAIALNHRPHAVCVVPESARNATTEGGLDVAGQEPLSGRFIAPLRDAGSRVSCSSATSPPRSGAGPHRRGGGRTVYRRLLRLRHRGRLAERDAELAALREGAALAASLGLEVHAGHGLTFDTVGPIAAIPESAKAEHRPFPIEAESVFIGLGGRSAKCAGAWTGAPSSS